MWKLKTNTIPVIVEILGVIKKDAFMKKKLLEAKAIKSLRKFYQ